MDAPEIRLLTPDTPELLDATREIFREYAASLEIDLCFQNFEARAGDAARRLRARRTARCCSRSSTARWPAAARLRPLPDADYANACEMKRLYVRPAFRRFGLGRVLAQALLDEAQRAGYSAMLLDTLDDMEAARELYASLGFEEIPPYYYNPIPGAHYLKAALAEPLSRSSRY